WTGRRPVTRLDDAFTPYDAFGDFEETRSRLTPRADRAARVARPLIPQGRPRIGSCALDEKRGRRQKCRLHSRIPRETITISSRKKLQHFSIDGATPR